MQQRLFQIRLALGGGVRPMPFEEFAGLIRRETGASYDVSALSRMETGKRKVGLEDVEAIAKLDPHRRGAAWLAFGTPATQANGYAIANERPVFVPRVGPRPPDPVEVETPRRPSEGSRKRRGA